MLHLCLQRKQPKGKGKAQTDGAAASERKNAQTSANVVVDASQEPVVVDATQESVVVDATQPSEDLFDDLPDEVIASIEEVMETDEHQQKGVKKMKALKIEKVNNVKMEKPKAVKNKPSGQVLYNGQVLYHGQRRRSSERIQMNAFKKPFTGIGSSDGKPIVIKEGEGVLTQDDAAKTK
jgi:hypothetical protein